MSWKPIEEQIKIMKTISSMTIDCIMGSGTDNEETYLSNLRFMANLVEKEPKKEKGG